MIRRNTLIFLTQFMDKKFDYLTKAIPELSTSLIEEYDTQNYLLEKIKKRVENKDYPVFVTAGNGKEKLTHIRHNQYLAFCYENLCTVEGSLITFGFNFGQYDEHIIKAINIAAKHGKKELKEKSL